MTPAANEPLASLTPAANLQPVPTTLAKKGSGGVFATARCQRYTRKTFVLEPAEPDNDD
jgi:hypothetical protein